MKLVHMRAKRKRAPPVKYQPSSARGAPNRVLAEDPISSLSSDESPRAQRMKTLSSLTSESSFATTEYESSWSGESDLDDESCEDERAIRDLQAVFHECYKEYADNFLC